MPKELSQWTPGGVDLGGLDTPEAGLGGDVLCQSRWSLEAPVCSPAPGGGPVPLGVHRGGAWLVEEALRVELFTGVRKAGADLLCATVENPV